MSAGSWRFECHILIPSGSEGGCLVSQDEKEQTGTAGST